MSEYNRYREEEKELEEQEKNEQEENVEKCDQKEKCGECECECQNEHPEGCCSEEIEQLKSEIARLQDLLLRNAAELENFKRRMNEERIRDRKYAMESYFRELIDIIDVFDKAVSFEPKEEILKNYLIGFRMINDRLKTSLANEGVRKIEADKQKFDPSVHHALEKTHYPDIDEGLITEVILDGYMYKDRVLRPSLVKVNSHEPEPDENEDQNENNSQNEDLLN